ncbi:MAG: DUF3857 domain-containing protein [Mucilaginibacter polytrichastri]|nr:DUF3857 domain-containing protein [Mucilaginibacter polytrichastri]
MKQLYLILFFLCGHYIRVLAQDFEDFKDKNPDNATMDMRVYPADTSASAVVLKEFGDARMLLLDEGTRLRVVYHVRIKILSNKGIEHGTVTIPLYHDGERQEKVESITAQTFYHDDDKLLRIADLDQKNIFRENRTKNVELVKFTMPALKAGCVIDVRYVTVSPYIFTFHKWDFQDAIPKMESRYVVHIPANYTYKVSLRGPFKLSENKAEIERECFNFGSTKADCSRIIYAMKDIPAFVEEDYMTAAGNFLASMNFELSDYTTFSGVKTNVTKNWRDVDYELKTVSGFGGQLKKGDLFKTQMPAILAGAADELDKAKRVYAYIQKHFKWNGNERMLSEEGIKRALDNRSGNSADINLSLYAALKSAGLQPEAVILSTRSNGFVNRLYPVLSEFNYTIVQLTVGENSYLLDATDPYLSFGMLPLRCFNDQGRVVSLNKPSYWIDLKSAQKENSTTQFDVELLANGKMKGVLTMYSQGYEAYNRRRAIHKFNSSEEYVDDLDEKWAKTKITKWQIDNIDSLDKTLVEKYEVEMSGFTSMDAGQLFFNPYLVNRITENPFKQNERTYPVDFGVSRDAKVHIRIHFPENLEVVSLPPAQALSLPNKGGRFISQVTVEGNELSISQITQFNNAIYMTEEYPYLKELYNRIIQTQKTDIIFRKKTS